MKKTCTVPALVAGLVALAVGGCEEQPTEEPRAAAQQPPSAKAPPADEPTAEAQGDPVNTPEEIVKEPHFELRLSESGPYKAGELGRFTVRVAPRGKYHINEEFPYSVRVKPPEGVQVPKKELQTDDAEEFGEKIAKFAVPFTAEKGGTHRIEADVDFAVCTEDNCIPEQRTLALNISVE